MHRFQAKSTVHDAMPPTHSPLHDAGWKRWVIARWTKADAWEALGAVHSALLRYMRLGEGVDVLDNLKRIVEYK
jgi:hypothetical protein